MALVIFMHLCISGGLPFFQTVIDFGNLGVRIFFVISGFIITTLLIQEKERTGAICLRAFYVRRCFRILPIWAVYLGVMLPALVVTNRTPPLRDLIGVLTYNVDYLRPETVDFGHMWSLSVEEKFYLLWPLVMANARMRTATAIALATIVVVPLLRVYEAVGGALYYQLLEPFHVSADAIATGCLLALLRSRLERAQKWRAFIRSPWPLILPAVVLGVGACHKMGPGFWLVGITIMNFTIAAGIYYVVSQPRSIPGRILNSRPFVMLGAWSYGLYLWQQPLTFHRKAGFLSIFPVNVIILLAVTAVGYYIVEKPAQDYGRRLSTRLFSKTSKTKSVGAV